MIETFHFSYLPEKGEPLSVDFTGVDITIQDIGEIFRVWLESIAERKFHNEQ
jgi:hypothetical protein